MAKKLNKKKLILGSIFLIAIILLAVGVVFWFFPPNPYKHLRGEKGVDASGQKISDQELYSADKLLEKGDLDGARKVYDSRIKDAEGDNSKAQENVTAANAFMNLGQSTNKDVALKYALAYAQEAERLDPTMSSAAILAVVYDAMGNSERESYYYAKVDERSKGLNEQHSVEDQSAH